ASAAAQLERAGYWNNPEAPGHDHGPDGLGSDASAPAATPGGGVDDVIGRQDDASEGRRIDGSAENAGQRSQRSTPDGKPIVVDPLFSGTGVEIARERTVADGSYVSSDQLVLTTGARDDVIGVRQRDDGTLDVNVNGESYEVR